MASYAHPETLASTEWLPGHMLDPGVRVVEVDVDTSAYKEGHIPGAIAWDWHAQLCDNVRRDILAKRAFEALMEESGISNDTTVVLYGDNNNWFAAWAFWQMKIYGHQDVRILNGGRKKWIMERRELDLEPVRPALTEYRAADPDLSIRALLPRVESDGMGPRASLVDVRSPLEFSGEILSPPGLPETCQRGGHIPNARNVPWGEVCKADGTFESYDELKFLYARHGIDGSGPVIAYCRIGERSAHTWFVLKYLLGFKDVANYDGSWTEWGNLVAAPVETGAPARQDSRR